MGIRSKLVMCFEIATNTIFTYKNTQITYYNQRSLQYYFKPYGGGKMGTSACGPFACAIVASSLLKETIRPDEVARWSYENGFYESGHGTFHSLISAYCQSVGLQCDDLGYRVDELKERLEKKNTLAILLCKEKTFARGRHFVAVGMRNGKFKVYNSSNVFDCYKSFEEKEILDALAIENVYIGPIWCVSRI